MAIYGHSCRKKVLMENFAGFDDSNLTWFLGGLEAGPAAMACLALLHCYRCM